MNLKGLPSAPMRESVSGLKLRSPAKAIAVTMSGEATKACVAGFASLRPVKLRLYEVMTAECQLDVLRVADTCHSLEFFSPFFTSFLSH